MRFPQLLIILLLICMAAPALAQPEQDGKLLKTVVLSRHGVRSPTQDAKILEMWSQKQWPQWPVGKGELTERGSRLVTAMWHNLGQTMRRQKLLSSAEDPKVYIRADVDERTRATARAMLRGLAPNAQLKYHVLDGKLDPLFHPVKAGLYRYDAIEVATDVLAQTHGGLERLADDFSGGLNLLDIINGSPSPTLCSRFAMMPKCKLTDLPNAISVSPDGTGIRVVGSLGIASSLAEIFLLEYGEWPDQNAGWGQVDLRTLSQILPIHSRIFDVVNRARLVAWANGSALLSEMTKALLGDHANKEINDAKLVIFVGHDTNIANVGGLLKFFWQASGYPPNGIPPAGALFLELWEKKGQRYVHARFEAQPPKALHLKFTETDDYSGHAPVSVAVYYKNDPVIYKADTFKELVATACDGAPVIDQEQKLVLE